MKVVGHRGAAGLEPENTLKSISKAFELGVDAVEFDIRITKDRKLVLCHDADLSHMTGSKKLIRDANLNEIKKLPTLSGEPIAELHEALDILKNKTAFLEPKDSDMFEELMNTTNKFSGVDIRFTTREHDLLKQIKSNYPQSKIYPTNYWIWYSVARQIRKLDADGVSINYRLLNPVTYWMVKSVKAEVMVFTLDDAGQIEKASRLFKDAWICTNRPDIALNYRN